MALASASAAGGEPVFLKHGPDGTQTGGGNESGDEGGGGIEAGGGTDANAPGCLLPLFDMLNHKRSQPLTWVGSPDGGVCFHTDVRLDAGSEVFNNYGDRPNEELLFSYGYCVQDNPDDAVLVSLVTAFPDAEGMAAGAQPTRESFYVRRSESGGVPVELQQEDLQQEELCLRAQEAVDVERAVLCMKYMCIC